MNHEELFVGGVAVVLGVIGIAAAISNWDSYYQVNKARWIEAVGGRICARLVYGFVGFCLIALGIAIALGFGPNKGVSRVRSFPREGGSPLPETVDNKELPAPATYPSGG